MNRYQKRDLPVAKVRRFLEPGPIVLVSSKWKGATNIMTMGWHMVMGFEPSLIGCYIWDANHSFEMLRRSKECVINIPTEDIAAKVVGIGNSSGRDIDKFKKFRLTAAPSKKVNAPLIAECYANFECRLADSSLINKYSLFVWEVVRRTQRHPLVIRALFIIAAMAFSCCPMATPADIAVSSNRKICESPTANVMPTCRKVRFLPKSGGDPLQVRLCMHLRIWLNIAPWPFMALSRHRISARRMSASRRKADIPDPRSNVCY
jgi:flavin reductase (DIM6/NTAB) family NADH-FMN oxidoreductase RutF